jgi:MFS family permease
VVGIGEAGYYPAGTSLLGDYFPSKARARAMSIWGAGTAVGIAVGFAGGGYVAMHYGWRAAFLMTAVPGLIFAVLAFTLREPLRGAAEAHGPKLQTAHHANLGTMLGLLRNRTLLMSILSQTALFFVLAANAFWLPVALNRRFNMDVQAAGTFAGGVIVLGGLIGTLLGGFLAERRGRTSPGANLETGIVGFIAAAVFITVALVVPAFPVFALMFLLAVVALYMYSGPFTALSQDVVVPSMRASAVTVSLFIAHLFGDSYSPVAVGVLSDGLHDLNLALLIVSPTLLLVAAGFAAAGMRTIRRDRAAMELAWSGADVEVLPDIAPEKIPAV